MARNRAQSDKDNLRQEIMDAARELFVADGYDSVSMRKIADKIGYSATTIYLYFKDKNDLLNRICEQTFVRLAQNITAISGLSDNPIARLRAGMREYIHFGLRNPEQYTLVFIVPLPRDYVPNETNTGAAAFDTLREVVTECVAAGYLKHTDVELISQTIWACIHGLTALLIQHKGFAFVDRELLIDSLIDTCLAGIRE